MKVYKLKVLLPSSNTQYPSKFLDTTIEADDYGINSAGCYKFYLKGSAIAMYPIQYTIIESIEIKDGEDKAN